MTTTVATGPEIARGLAPLIREHADEGERERHIPRVVAEAMRDAGLFRMAVPASLGGWEADPLTVLDTVEAVAEADASTGWCLFIGAGGPVTGMFLDDTVAEEIFSDANTILCGSTAPPGRAVTVDGGYALTGRWTFASGNSHATWVLAFAQAFDGETPRTGPSGAPEMRVAFLPRDEAQFLDTWDVSGLCATGSSDFVLEDQFVVNERTFAMRPGPRGRHYQGTLYRLPFLTLFAYGIAAVATGTARSAINVCLDLAVNKKPRGSEVPLRDKPLFQYQLAEALTTLESGRSWFRSEVEDCWKMAQRSEEIDIQKRARLGLAATNCVRSAARATELMYTAGGGTSLYTKSPLQRALRDSLAMTQHTAVAPQTIENAGAILTGHPSASPLLYL